MLVSACSSFRRVAYGALKACCRALGLNPRARRLIPAAGRRASGASPTDQVAVASLSVDLTMVIANECTEHLVPVQLVNGDNMISFANPRAGRRI
jgi:hypothetical protein